MLQKAFRVQVQQKDIKGTHYDNRGGGISGLVKWQQRHALRPSDLLPDNAPVFVSVTSIVTALSQRRVTPEPRPEQSEDITGSLFVGLLLLGIGLCQSLSLDWRNGELRSVQDCKLESKGLEPS